ncbi:MAG TPA: nucleotidyltransferase domain-containing protein [Bryobacteraceae bacterium]|nr:nucleotidyltransferase domain-containing protein [Bryobacteraceae bacterium]
MRREEILHVAARHGAGNVLLFGSVARGEETPESDVDLLVDVTGETTPWFPGSLVADLEQLLERPVQIVIRRSLSPLIRESVLREAIPL